MHLKPFHVAAVLPLLFCLTFYSPAAEKSGAPQKSAFFGEDLVVVGQPYSLRLPAGAKCEVSWGDGAVERVAQNTATHTYTKSGVANITVKARQDDGKWLPLPLDYTARVQVSRPVLFVAGPVKVGAVLPKVLTAPADSFSIEARVQFDAPASDQVIFASRSEAAGTCRFGIKNRSLFLNWWVARHLKFLLETVYLPGNGITSP